MIPTVAAGLSALPERRASPSGAASGFGETWNATQASSTPSASPSHPDRPALDQTQAQTADPAAQDAAGAKAPNKKLKSVAADAKAADQQSDPKAGSNADLLALQGLIAAMTGQPSAAAPTRSAGAPAAAGGDAASPAGAGGLARPDELDGSSSAGPLLVDGGALQFALEATSTAATGPQPGDAVAQAGEAQSLPDQAVAHQLDLAGDGAWLDQLARDITRSASADGQLRFTLAPEHLGRLEVQMAAGADGTAIRLSTETRDAHRIISDAQPQLVAEARAQGLRISDTHVDLNGGGSSGAGHQSFGNQNSGGRAQPQHSPLIPEPTAPTVAMPAEEGAADALYA